MLRQRNLLFLCAILSIAAVTLPAVVWAQAKSDKGKAKSAERLRFEVYEDTAKEFRWRLVTGEGDDRHVLATGGQGYKSKADCLRGVKTIQDASAKLTFETYNDKEKKSRWRAKSSNGETVAASGSSYKTKAESEKEIAAIRRLAAKAPIDDLAKTKK
jgi:uncharacterized protein YegP (UPF0339 family)